jgi:hypothetical protein
MLVVERESRAMWINTLDRTAMALEELRKLYPQLTAQYPIVYSGPAPHVFLDRYRAAAKAEDGRTP